MNTQGNIVPLTQLGPGECGEIHSVHSNEPHTLRRLLEFGMTAGSRVEFVRSAPLGDPIEIKLKGYRLSLRKHEADSVSVRRSV
jgi:ferrous iron transport protein A